jgi:hypothetical protein
MSLKQQLTAAMASRKPADILYLSAEVAHYLADAHVPLHTTANYNGQLTGQLGVHALWETAVPKAGMDRWWLMPTHLAPDAPFGYTYWHKKLWDLMRLSYDQADTVLRAEQEQRRNLPVEKWYAPTGNGQRNTYSPEFIQRYVARMEGMVQRNMKASAAAIALFWYGAWVEAGQPALIPAREGDVPPGLWQELKHLKDQTVAYESPEHEGSHCGACCHD